MHRAIAIAIELIILAAVILCLLWAVRLVLFDLRLGNRYKPMITLALGVVSGVLMLFLIAHLISFYPS